METLAGEKILALDLEIKEVTQIVAFVDTRKGDHLEYETNCKSS